jgi:hypothetical protein
LAKRQLHRRERTFWCQQGRIFLNEEQPGRARLCGEGRALLTGSATEGDGSEVGGVREAGGAGLSQDVETQRTARLVFNNQYLSKATQAFINKYLFPINLFNFYQIKPTAAHAAAVGLI